MKDSSGLEAGRLLGEGKAPGTCHQGGRGGEPAGSAGHGGALGGSPETRQHPYMMCVCTHIRHTCTRVHARAVYIHAHTHTHAFPGGAGRSRHLHVANTSPVVQKLPSVRGTQPQVHPVPCPFASCHLRRLLSATQGWLSAREALACRAGGGGLPRGKGKTQPEPHRAVP